MSKDIVAKTGEYTDKEGKSKFEWTKVGVVLSSEHGEYILLDPSINLSGVLQKQNMLAVEQRKAGKEKARTGKAVMCSVFDREANQQGQGAPAQQQSPPSDFEDETIPF